MTVTTAIANITNADMSIPSALLEVTYYLYNQFTLVTKKVLSRSEKGHPATQITINKNIHMKIKKKENYLSFPPY